jgi:5-methylthioribose kinase
MFELTAANAIDYLRGASRLGPGPVRVEPLGWGVSNLVLRVETADQLYVLKQSRPQLRTRDAWFSDLDRVYREQEVMEVLGPRLPPLVVPRVLFVDRPNYVFAMEHAPRESRVWKEQLLAGDIDLSLGEHIGAILGRIHQLGTGQPELFERFADPTVFVQLRVDPFYRRIQERRPDLACEVGKLIERMLKVQIGLCHGDYSPKNILTHAQGFTLVDYETSYWGDPTMDLGFCLSHLLLKAVKRSQDRQRHLELTRAFWRGYQREATFGPLAELVRFGIAHCAVCLLARVDGTSPVDYLPEQERKDAVRELGKRLLLEGVRTWEEVMGLAEMVMQRLDQGEPT